MNQPKRRGRPPGKKKEKGIELSTKVNFNESRKIKVQFELEVKVSNVKVVEWGENL